MTLITTFCVTFLKITYATPRPYWLDHDMSVPVCSLDYSGPSDHLCVGAFFYCYTILIYIYEYAEHKNYLLISICFVSAGILLFSTALALFFLGQTFLFSSTVGIIYSTIFAIACMDQDHVINKYCEKLAFDIKKSRRYKFYILFICTAMFAVVFILYRFAVGDYRTHPEWIQSTCLQEKKFKYRLGLDYTFFDFTVILKIIGTTFGCALANSAIGSDFRSNFNPHSNINYAISALRMTPKAYNENIGGSESGGWTKYARTFLGITLYIGFVFLFWSIPTDNYFTDYAIRMVGSFTVTYVFYGLYPIMCDYIGLYQYESESSSCSSEESESKYKAEPIVEDEDSHDSNKAHHGKSKGKVYDYTPKEHHKSPSKAHNNKVRFEQNHDRMHSPKIVIANMDSSSHSRQKTEELKGQQDDPNFFDYDSSFDIRQHQK